MAEQVRRINDKGTLANGTASTNLSQSDILLMQHITGDGKDYKLPISQATAIPYGTTGTAAATAEKVVTLSNYPATYTVTVGSKVLVKFTYANTASSQMKLKVGSQASAYPCKCRGVNMMSGCVKAGAIVEFTFTGAEWNCQFCENDSAINSALTTYPKVYRQSCNSSKNIVITLKSGQMAQLLIVAKGSTSNRNYASIYQLYTNNANTEEIIALKTNSSVTISYDESTKQLTISYGSSTTMYFTITDLQGTIENIV